MYIWGDEWICHVLLLINPTFIQPHFAGRNQFSLGCSFIHLMRIYILIYIYIYVIILSVIQSYACALAMIHFSWRMWAMSRFFFSLVCWHSFIRCVYIYIYHNFERHSVLRMRACNDSFFVKDVSNEQIFFSLVCWSIVGQDRKYKGISSFLFQFHRMIIISNELHHWVMHAHTHWVTPIESRTQTRKHPENQQDEIAIIN